MTARDPYEDADTTVDSPVRVALVAAALVGGTVTLTTVEGEFPVTGTVRLHPTIPDLFILQPAGRSRRAAVIHPDDVEELINE